MEGCELGSMKVAAVASEGSSSAGAAGALRTLLRSVPFDHHLRRPDVVTPLLDSDGSRDRGSAGDVEREKRTRTFSTMEQLRFGTKSSFRAAGSDRGGTSDSTEEGMNVGPGPATGLAAIGSGSSTNAEEYCGIAKGDSRGTFSLPSSPSKDPALETATILGFLPGLVCGTQGMTEAS